ncbi:MAG: hypothetical protein R2779_04365 [Crocinitomicaceae bacterium]
MGEAYGLTASKLGVLNACSTCKNTLKQHKVYGSEVVALTAFAFI